GPRPRRRTELRGRGRRPSLRPLTAGALPMTTPSATIRERGTYRTLLPAEDWVTRAIPGGALLLMATVLSLLFANTPLSDLYFTVRDTYLGFDLGPLSLKLTIGHWAAGGWAIPAATDIAFAIAILALLGSSLPTALRTVLLTLAIVDDLIAITIIAIFYTSDLQLWYLALALVPMAAFWWLANRREAWF